MRAFVEAHKDELVCIQYHTWWPWSNDPYYRDNVTENTNRTQWYNVGGVPHIIYDGRTEPVFPYTLASLEAAWTTLNHDASMDINITGVYDPNAKSGEGTITAEIIAYDAPTGTDNRALIVFCEDGLQYTMPNGVSDHFWVMRDMIPNEDGIPVSFEEPYPDTAYVTQDFTVFGTWNPDSLYLVVCVQNFGGSPKIKQGQRIKLEKFDLPAVVAMDDGFGPRAHVLGQNFPNPCNPTTVIPVTLSEPGEISLGIYDVEGRLVRNLMKSTLSAGTHDIEWDGRDEAGRRVASGIYYYRLERANGPLEARKMVVIR